MSLVNNRNEVVLEHYGKKGMKWGVRKKRTPTKGKKGSSSKLKKMVKKKMSSLSTPEAKQTIKEGAIATGILVAAVGGIALLSYMDSGPARKSARKAAAGLQRNIDANTVRDINRLFTGAG